MSNWTYKGESGLVSEILTIDDLPKSKEAIGFVYKITNRITGTFYIGKKSLYSERKTKISTREKVATATRKKFKQVVKESDWKKYWGSCADLKEDVQIFGSNNFTREIIEVCCTKKYLGFCEVIHQIKNDVLTSNSYNGNIMGKYFPGDMENCNCD